MRVSSLFFSRQTALKRRVPGRIGWDRERRQNYCYRPADATTHQADMPVRPQSA